MGLEPELLSSNARLNCAMARDAKQANKENLGRILIFWRAPAVRTIILYYSSQAACGIVI